MTELAEWLTAILDEDEALAQAARKDAASPWYVLPDEGLVRHSGPNDNYQKDDGLWDSEGCTGTWHRLCMTEPVANHVARHDPASVLADVAAKRAILETCTYYLHEYESGIDPCAASVFRAIALAYTHRPGFRPEWVDD